MPVHPSHFSRSISHTHTHVNVPPLHVWPRLACRIVSPPPILHVPGPKYLSARVNTHTHTRGTGKKQSKVCVCVCVSGRIEGEGEPELDSYGFPCKGIWKLFCKNVHTPHTQTHTHTHIHIHTHTHTHTRTHVHRHVSVRLSRRGKQLDSQCRLREG